MPAKRTPIRDTDQKIDLIDHMNDDHREELLIVAQAHSDEVMSNAMLQDIFEEGCILQVTTTDGATSEQWIPFVLKGDLEEQILYVAYSAMVRQGKSLGNKKKHYFEVVGSHYVTPHLFRLLLTSERAFPTNAPGFAWLFSLKTFQQQPKEPATPQRQSTLAQLGNRLFFWGLRFLSFQRREKIMMSFTKDLRYYTLRSVTNDNGQSIAAVDIYLHGDTPGGNWATSLQPGNMIVSTSEYEEHTDHLTTGNALLIADETSLPTVAALLENWQNALPPHVISITSDTQDSIYLDTVIKPAGTQIHHVQGNTDDVHDKVIALIRTIPDLDVAWGALENNDAKRIRKYLREERHLEGKTNRIKGYWKRKENTLQLPEEEKTESTLPTLNSTVV